MTRKSRNIRVSEKAYKNLKILSIKNSMSLTGVIEELSHAKL